MVELAVAVAVAVAEESLVVTVAVAIAVAVTVASSSADAVAVATAVAVSSAATGVTCNNGAEQTNNAAARMKIVFLKFMLPPYWLFIFSPLITAQSKRTVLLSG